jgi:hypothetical protein
MSYALSRLKTVWFVKSRVKMFAQQVVTEIDRSTMKGRNCVVRDAKDQRL